MQPYDVGNIQFFKFEYVLGINSTPIKETILPDRTIQNNGEPFMLHMYIAMPEVLGWGDSTNFQSEYSVNKCI